MSVTEMVDGDSSASRGKSRIKIPKLTEGEVVAAKTGRRAVTITAPKLDVAVIKIRGIAPYVQNAFSAKARQAIRDTQEAGSTSNKGKKREPKDFQACYEAAKHKAAAGWLGMPAPAFRCAMISACRLIGFKMTLAKLSVFIEADGLDVNDSSPLVKITKGEPRYYEAAVRNDNGSCDLRARPMWDPGWEATVRVRYDADQFLLEDVINLMARVGLQVGIGEGRPDSRKSAGMGFGLFEIING